MRFFNDFITAIDTRFSRTEARNSAECMVRSQFYQYRQTPLLMDCTLLYVLCEVASIDQTDEANLEALLRRDLQEWETLKDLYTEQVAFDNLLEKLFDLSDSHETRGKEETLGDHIKWLALNWWKIEGAPGKYRARLFEICEYHGLDAEYCYNTIQVVEDEECGSLCEVENEK